MPYFFITIIFLFVLTHITTVLGDYRGGGWRFRVVLVPNEKQVNRCQGNTRFLIWWIPGTIYCLWKEFQKNSFGLAIVLYVLLQNASSSNHFHLQGPEKLNLYDISHLIAGIVWMRVILARPTSQTFRVTRRTSGALTDAQGTGWYYGRWGLLW